MPLSQQAALIAKHNQRLTMDFISCTRRHFDEDLISALLFAGVVAGNVERNQGDRFQELPTGAMPADLRQPVHGRSLALSLGVPAETARIKLNSLVERSILASEDGGFTLSSSTLASPPFAQAIGEYIRAVSIFLGQLSTLGAFDMTNASVAFKSPGSGAMAVRFATTHVLRTLETARSSFAEISPRLLYTLLAIADETEASVMLTTRNRSAALIQQTPSTTSIAKVAESTRLPHETVRRSTFQLLGMGLVHRDDRQWRLKIEDETVANRWAALAVSASLSTQKLIRQMRGAGLIGFSGEHNDAQKNSSEGSGHNATPRE